MGRLGGFRVKVSLAHSQPTVWPGQYKPHSLNPLFPPKLQPTTYLYTCLYMFVAKESNPILWSVVGIRVYSPT